MSETHTTTKQKAQSIINIPEPLLTILKIATLPFQVMDYFLKLLIFSHHDKTKSIRAHQQRQAETIKQQRELIGALKSLTDKL